MKIYSGSCLCKGVSFEIMGPISDALACHCQQCRKTSGHYSVVVHVPTYKIELLRYESLKWFQSMEPVEKGFCSECGSSLFWNFSGRDGWGVSAGAFDGAVDFKISHHCFTSEKLDYHKIDDGLPQAPQFDLEVSHAPKVKKTNNKNTKSKE